MKIIENIKKQILNWKIKKLSKVAVVFEHNWERRYMEPGPKTYGRFRMFKALNLVLRKIYTDNYEKKLGLNGIYFNEDEYHIYLKISLHRPGLLIGRSGVDIEELQNTLTDVYGKSTKVEIEETEWMYGLDSINIL